MARAVTEPTEPTTAGASGESLDATRSAGKHQMHKGKQVRVERVDTSKDDNKGAEARACTI